jgi:hypothetical protein
MDLGDGGFVHLKRRWRLGRRRQNGDGGEKGGEEADAHGGMILNTPVPTQMTLVKYSRAADLSRRSAKREGGLRKPRTLSP